MLNSSGKKIIFTIGEAAWSTCGVSGKEGGREGGHFKKINFNILNFRPWEAIWSTSGV